MRYVLTKLSFLVVTYLVSITIVFLLPRLIPGNPLAQLLTQLFQQAQTNPETIKEVYKTLMAQFNLNKPLWEQYLDFLARAIQGDLGTSIAYYPRKVIDLIMPAIPWTLALLVPATLTAWFLGNNLGAIAGYKRNSLFEKLVLTTSLVISQIPYYWLAMVLLYVFSVKFGIFPSGGGYSYGLVPSLSLTFIVDFLWHYTLPFLSIVLVSIGGWAIGMRLLVIYELESDYMVFSESLGIKESKLFNYAFRNSLLPQITGLALSLGGALGGQLITETVFNYPGTGYVLFRGLSTLDYPMIQGVFIIIVATLFLANFLVDLIYALIDPRIRLGYVQT
ncbi:MAG TPA: ABC transporter permease [Thermofilum sp.]|nr:ABC transporter permease [Thermofilum sp.]